TVHTRGVESSNLPSATDYKDRAGDPFFVSLNFIPQKRRVLIITLLLQKNY
ncbi:hypothetical protein HMPREF2738_02637, partial [Clostridiales bacterium KLE1615]